MANNEEKNILLGFLALFETINKDGNLGVILITDQQGIPKEFRCTYPVKPTTVQKRLYGDTLEPHVGIKLCGIPLIAAIQLKPSLIIVDKEFLLGVREETQYPTIYLRRAGESLEIEIPDIPKNKQKRERIDCPTGKFQPVIISSHPDFEEDRSIAKEIIEKTYSYLDPCEPFERMEKAIEVLGKQDDKFQ